MTNFAGVALVVGLALSMGGCASSPPAPTPEELAARAAAAKPKGPGSFAEAETQFSDACPGPFFQLPTPETVKAAEHVFRIEGSTVRVDPDYGPLREGAFAVGVLGAVKDAEPETRDNIKKAARKFAAAHVDAVFVNGDVVGDQTGDLPAVFAMLGEEISVPVFLHSGNYEWTNAFTEASVEARKKYPHLFNMNLLRHVNWRGLHFFSLPGWSNRRFVKAAACYYDEDDVTALQAEIKKTTAAGDIVVVVAHGPPRGRGKQALDFANEAGNVGDEALTALLRDVPVNFGLFSHILEAGGRATSDMNRQLPVKLPMHDSVRPLYINAGSASSYGWAMLDGKTSRGMAAIVTFDKLTEGGAAKVEFVKLR